MAISATVQEAIYLDKVLKSMMKVYANQHDPIKIHCDNQGTIALVKNPISHNRTKHIDIRFHFIRDHFNKKMISMHYVESGENIADLMTKPGTLYKYRKFERMLFGE